MKSLFPDQMVERAVLLDARPHRGPNLQTRQIRKLYDVLDAIPQTGRLLLYPSSCVFHEELLGSPYEALVLNNLGHRFSERRRDLFCTRFDNNTLLSVFRYRNIRPEAVVLIRDGCMEGGNSECCQGDAFMSRLLSVVGDEFDLFIDSHNRHRIKRLPLTMVRLPAIPEYIERLIQHSDPIGIVRGLRCRKIPARQTTLRLGNIQVRLVHDSCWNHLQSFDTLFLPVRQRWATSRFLACCPKTDVRFFQPEPPFSVLSLLEKALAEQRSRIGFLPFAHGQYHLAIRELSEWPHPYPSQVSLFHLHARDYSDFYRQS